MLVKMYLNSLYLLFISFAAPKCGPNKKFVEDASQCPNTCDNLEAEKDCDEEPQMGCVCEKDYVLSGFDCVPKKDCGCTFQDRYHKVCFNSSI